MAAPDGDGKPPRTTTAQSRELGMELRTARKRAGMRGSTVAEELGWSTAKLSKLEKGWRGTSPWEIGTLLGKCGTDKATRDRIMRLAHEPNIGCFVRPHDGGLADDLLSLSLHERTALTITCYEPMVIPGLLQVEKYTRALLADTSGSADALDTFVRTRAVRQAALRGDRAPTSTFYIHETALHVTVGNPATMHDQLARLTFLSDSERLTLRVIPMSAGGSADLLRPSTLLTFGRGMRSLVVSETDAATVFADEEQAVKAHQRKHAALSTLALNVERSRALLTDWADTYARTNGGIPVRP